MATRFLLRDAGNVALIRRLFAETARRYVRQYALAFVLMAVVAAGTAGAALITRDLVDGIFFDRDRTMLLLIPAVIVLIFVVRGFAAYGATTILSRIGNGIVAGLQQRLYDKILSLDVDYFTRTHSSELINRMSHNTLAAREVLNKIVISFGKDLLTLIGLIAVMIGQGPLLALLTLVIGPVAIFAVARLIRRIKRIAGEEFHLLGRIISSMQETAQGIRIVKAFNLEPLMRAQMQKSIDDVQERANKAAIIGARTGPIMETLAGVAIAGVTLYAGYAVINLGAAPGAFMAFITAMLLAYEPATRLARLNVQIAGHLVGVRIMYDLLDAPVPPEETGKRPITVTRGEIVFDDVTFRYRDDVPLFEGLNFRAGAGQTTALVGPSGAGKSTVISLIERFYSPSAGRVVIDGQDIADVDAASLRDHIALVSQEIRLFNGTIRDNIRLGRPDASDAAVEEAARNALADDFIRALPQGYDTPVGEQGGQLSGGQRQRLAIARAMLRDARIVLLDEATSALDSESEHQIQIAFDRLKRGRTTVVIAHRLSTVLNADSICVFANGAIVEEGRHEALLAAGRLYTRLYRLQFDLEARKLAEQAAAE